MHSWRVSRHNPHSTIGPLSEIDMSDDADVSIQLGLGPNLAQFSLLVVVNAFVGAMVGLERSILPAIAEQEFHLAARTAVLSFIVVFGIVKAVTNYFAGRLSDSIGRKAVLVGGWFIALPIPFILMWHRRGTGCLRRMRFWV